MKKLMVMVMILGFGSLGFAGTCLSADIHVGWDPVAEATGYKLYKSTDLGVTWDAGMDVGNVTEFTVTGVPDAGVVLFRVSAYNGNGEAVRYDAGVFHCGDCIPPGLAGSLGIQ